MRSRAKLYGQRAELTLKLVWISFQSRLDSALKRIVFFFSMTKVNFCWFCSFFKNVFSPKLLATPSLLKLMFNSYISITLHSNAGKRQRHVALSNVSAISPFVYRCWWIQKLSKRTIKWANHDGSPPLPQSPIVGRWKELFFLGREPFPPPKRLSPLQSPSI